MKHLLSLAFLGFSLSGFSAPQTILDCRVVKVLNDRFEEGLSTHEYPNISVTKDRRDLEVSVGAMKDWETKNEDSIKIIRNTEDTRVVSFQYYDESSRYYLRASRNSSGKLVAKLSVNDDDGRGEILIAIAYCE